MRILLGNTGRGGELAVFTSLVNAYRRHLPDAHIELLTCDNQIYGPLFHNSPDHNGWNALQFRDKEKPHYMDPVGALKAYFKQTKDKFGVQEYACEYDLSPAFRKGNTGTILSNCYKRIKTKLFELDYVDRKIFIYPTDEERRFAEDTYAKYGKDLVLVSYVAKSASTVMNRRGYQDLCDHIVDKYPVAYTANRVEMGLQGHVDLRGITFSALFALAEKLQYFVGPDTATTWIVSNMPGTLIAIRGDNTYPIWNTGIKANGFRKGKATHEINFAGLRPVDIMGRIMHHISE
jgi:hypothetical protein